MQYAWAANESDSCATSVTFYRSGLPGGRLSRGLCCCLWNQDQISLDPHTFPPIQTPFRFFAPYTNIPTLAGRALKLTMCRNQTYALWGIKKQLESDGKFGGFVFGKTKVVVQLALTSVQLSTPNLARSCVIVIDGAWLCFDWPVPIFAQDVFSWRKSLNFSTVTHFVVT